MTPPPEPALGAFRHDLRELIRENGADAVLAVVIAVCREEDKRMVLALSEKLRVCAETITRMTEERRN